MRELLETWIKETDDQGAVFESTEVIAAQTQKNKKTK
jgi:hypothetical protein